MNYDRNTVSHHLESMLRTMEGFEKRGFFRRQELCHASGKPVESLHDLLLDDITTLFHYFVKDAEGPGFEIVETYMRLLKLKGETPSFADARDKLKVAIEPLKMAKLPPDIRVPEFYRLLTTLNTDKKVTPIRKESRKAESAGSNVIHIIRPSDRIKLRNGEITEDKALERQVAIKTPKEKIQSDFSTSSTHFKYLTEKEAEKLARDTYLLVRMLSSAPCSGGDMSVRRNSQKTRAVLFEYFREQGMRKPPSAGAMSAVARVRFSTRADPMDEGREERVEASTSRINRLIGLKSVKQEYGEMCVLFTDQALKKKLGLKVVDQASHMLFVGPPGTAKTEVAKMLGEDLFERKVLKKGHFTKVHARDFIGPYLGQSEQKTKKILESALGGVLFIDEIYALFSKDKEDSYAQAAITLILDFMEEHRGEFILIGAGYPDEVKEFLESNPGLRDRFKCVIDFPAYSHAELVEIFDYQLEHVYGYTVDDGVHDYVSGILQDELNRKDKHFGNGRFVRKIVEALERKKAVRLDKEGVYKNPDQWPEEELKAKLTRFTLEDAMALDPAKIRAEIKTEIEKEKKRPIGFIHAEEEAEKPAPAHARRDYRIA